MALVGPKKSPKDFGFSPGDYHLVVNDESETMKAFDHTGKLLWTKPCLARGIYGDLDYSRPNSDTPPGLYKVGEVYRDYENPDAVPLDVKLSFGWYTLDLVSLEGQEEAVGRGGVCLHGGGTGNGWPGAWEPLQRLLVTHGCVRVYNEVLKNLIMPMIDGGGRVYVSVFQET
jgi:L,D-transpeptidase catalytic domain